MAPVLSFKRCVELKLPRCMYLFIYAVLEWVMIMLISLDGFLALLSDEFARLFELNVSCLLCTRIDYVLSRSKSNFCFDDSICEEHKREISSLAYCHVHKKISDVRNMCESCLVSFATEKDSDCEKYKSLLGISAKSLKTANEDTPVERCSCCGELCKRPMFRRIPSIKAIAPSPSPRAWRNEPSRFLESPCMRFAELKIKMMTTSDNDSELPDEEDASTAGGRDDTKSEGIQEDVSCRTPTFLRGNRFYALSDSAQASPRIAKMLSDPNETNVGSEAGDGDILNRLKKQLRLDHKSVLLLKQELDEERNAAAIAANNAMAMITRLQGEKAALQMEAFQYQRMMEEEVEFDQEEVRLMKEMLIKNEEEMGILGSELEAYRLKYGPIERINGEAFEVHGDEDYQELRSHFLSSLEMSECASPDAPDHSAGNMEESSMHCDGV